MLFIRRFGLRSALPWRRNAGHCGPEIRRHSMHKTMLVGAAVAAVAGLAGVASGQIDLYAVNFTGNLYRVDTGTGLATLIAFTGTDRLNSAAANSAGEIFSTRARNPTLPTDTNRLIRIDRNTGGGTLVVDWAQANDIRGLAFVPGDRLFGTRDNAIADDLVVINPVSGDVTTIGPTGQTDLQGLTADASGQLWAVGVTTPGRIYRVD